MIDIHTHIIPGVDDGSADLSDSLLMARIAAEKGTSILVATPHSNLNPERPNFYGSGFRRRLEELQQRIREEEIGPDNRAGQAGSSQEDGTGTAEKKCLQILPGMEIFGTREVPDLIREGLLVGLNYTAYHLIEFDFGDKETYMTRILNRMTTMGLIPVVAHPERYDCVKEDIEVAKLWTEMGCVLQINAGSLLGKFGRSTQRSAQELFYEELVYMIASDAHSPYQRTPHLDDVWEFVADEYSPETAELLLEKHQRDILSSKVSSLAPEGAEPLTIIG